jgi:sn-glycerol 3-phosphate transport system substrate-binding protein
MTRRGALGSLVLALSILTLAGASPAVAQSRVQVEFWHGLNPPAGGLLEQIAADFNASQAQYQVNATFKGQYPDTMMAAIAASAPARPPTSCRCSRSAPRP